MAQSVVLYDPVENIGATLIKEAANNDKYEDLAMADRKVGDKINGDVGAGSGSGSRSPSGKC